MKLAVKARQGARKSEAKQLRRAGEIPAVVYAVQGKGKSSKIVVDRAEFEAALRGIKKGCLPTTVFSLKGDKGEIKAVVKDIQYHVTTYDVLHLDFQELKDDVAVNVNVPIHIKGAEICPGVKLGGIPRQVIRHVKVNCLPKAIPSELVLDASDMDMMGTKRLADIALPEGVRPLAKMTEVAVVIAKR